MAGIFGFLDFTREGPGVKKKGPEKRSFVTFFEIYFRKFWALICAGFWYALVNIPVVTRGMAEVGLTFITRNFSREKHAFIRADFFETIRKNWKQSLAYGLINLVVTGILVYNISYYALGMFPEIVDVFFPGDQAVGEPMSLQLMDYVILGFTLFGYVVFTFMKYYIPFMVVTFRLSLRQIYRNAMIFSMAGLKENLLISGVLVLVYALIFFALAWLPYAIVYALISLIVLLVLPAFRSFLIQYTIFPVIRKHIIDPYYAANPDADKQQRRDLGLDVEEPTVEEPVFTDTPAPSREQTTFPRQYSAQELRHAARKTAAQNEDDDTI